MASTYLQRTNTSGTNTYTFSAWLKLCNPEKTANQWIFTSNDGGLMTRDNNGTGGAEFHFFNADNNTNYYSGAKRRDTSGWYHIVLSSNSGTGTLYVNGETDKTGIVVPNLSTSSNAMQIGRLASSGSDYFDGLMTHVHWIDGTAYAASAFGSTDTTTGEWKINTSPSVTYGSQGFFILKNGNSLTDQSGNSNNFTLGGGTLTKTEDCPSNVFATWNPLQAITSASYTFEAGNTRLAVNDVDMSCGATLAAKTGKYYMEMKWVQQGGNDRWGIQPINSNVSNHVRTNGVAWDQATSQFYMLGNAVSGSWGGSIGTSDIIQLAMDLDNGALYLGVNGTYRNSGSPTSGSSRTGAVNFSGSSLFGKDLTFAVGKGNNGTSGWNANFGNGYIEQTAVSSAGTNASNNGIFEYDVPTGYTALSTKGLNT